MRIALKKHPPSLFLNRMEWSALNAPFHSRQHGAAPAGLRGPGRGMYGSGMFPSMQMLAKYMKREREAVSSQETIQPQQRVVR